MWRLVGLAGVLLLPSLAASGVAVPTGSTATPEFPMAIEGLDDGSHLWVGEGSVGRSVDGKILWARSVRGGGPGPVNDPVLEVHGDRVYVMNGEGAHAFALSNGDRVASVPYTPDGHHSTPDGALPLQAASGTPVALFGFGNLEVHTDGGGRTLWQTSTYVRAQPLDHDGDGDEVVLGLSGPDWPNDEWWLSAFGSDGTEHWNTTVQALERGFPCLQRGELDGTPGGEALLAVGGRTAIGVDGDGSVLWTAEGTGTRNTQHCRAGDVTGDGLTDLVVATFDPFDRGPASVSVFDGAAGQLRWTAPTHKGLSYLAFADADGDGIDDVLGATYGFSNPGFPRVSPFWPGGARTNHLTAFDGDAERVPQVLWHRTFTPNRGHASSGAADLEVLPGPDGDRVGLPLREAGSLLLVDPTSGETLDRLPGVHRAGTAAWLGDGGLVAGLDGHLWRSTGSGGEPWARVNGSVYDLDAGPAGVAAGYGQGVAAFDADGTPRWDQPLAGPAIHATWVDDRLVVGEQDADFEPPYQANLWAFTAEGRAMAHRAIDGALWDLASVDDRTGDGVRDLVVSVVGQGRFVPGGNELVDGASLLPVEDLPGPPALRVQPTDEGVLFVGQSETVLVDLATASLEWSRSVRGEDAVPLGDGTVLVSDGWNDDLERWSLDTGQTIETWQVPGPVDPGRLETAGSGTVVVGDANGDTAFAVWRDGTVDGPFFGQSPLACRPAECLGDPGPSLVTEVPVSGS